ncbi:AfsR/SARP family transcriptional regulator [Streptomyces griseoloalbus]|uniref:DNA-binding SARP family transcriptional activator/Flp pilus assembly protein TadD n=1 Tax=Streptomyces griseoloalbus TaxID=67303 RepID=A0A7W8FCL9_9ACTN|nr:BTAD domain-containing putative transcriptional regulator [Streptomyces albaduncus]MBB5128626.1 DNA-binding SARP family transcriptional activator/Flp pilus assembly protein TadD [Streptomyces albaduncus]GGW47213.1 SARP family transcriptional regulator [Streptomyces albaduncus]
MVVEFGLLGTIEARVEGRPANVGHMRQRCVLAALLVDVNRAVPVDALIDRVWGDRAPQRVRETLYGYLSRLRQALKAAPEVAISRRPGCYVLEADPLSVDLHLFRDLVARAREADDTRAAALMRQALGLWRGDPFATVDVPWFSDLRQALERERLSAELDHVDIRLRIGHHGELLPELTARAGEHPLDERLAGQLMLALYRTGRAADALACYEAVRRRLSRELGTDPGPRLRGLHRQILADDPALSPPEASPRRPPAGPETPPVPRQLPAPPACFVGRDAELSVLDKLLAPQTQPRTTMPMSVICGPGGVGKTWLALRWAHSRYQQFPDGQLFADLRGFTPSGDPADPFMVIRGFLDTLGVPPGRVPAAPDAQAALYRSLLADRQMLLVLDNAHDSEQTLPLLPGTPACTVLITSRDQLTGLTASHQVTHLTVDGFDSTTARELLTGRLGAERVAAEPDAATALVDQCAGLPLALSVVAARITTNPVVTLGDLTEELRESSTRLDALGTGESATDVRTVFASSYRALDPDTARVFRQLVQAPGPDIARPAAGSLTGLPPAGTRRALHRLRAAHLLQEHAPGRFSSHDLLRTYAIEVAGSVDGAEGRTARIRVLDHYLHTAWSADRILHPHRDPVPLSPAAPGSRPEELTTHDQAMEWFTREHPALVAAVHQAARHGHESHAWQLAWALTTFLTRSGRWSDVAAVHTTALAAATRLGDAAAQAESLRALSWERAEAGDHDAAHRRLTRALSLAQESGQTLSEAHTHLTLGWLHEYTGDRSAALRHDENAVRLFAQLDHRAGLARALNAVAWDHAQQGDHRAAVAHCEQAMAIQQELGDLRGEADTLDTLGYAYQQLGEHAQALACHRRGLELHRALGHRFNEAEALVHLGQVHLALGDPGAARRVLEQARDIYLDIEVHPSRGEQVRALLDSLGAGGAVAR